MLVQFDNNVTKKIRLQIDAYESAEDFIVNSKVDMFFICVDQSGNVYLWRRQPSPDFEYNDWDHNILGFQQLEYYECGFVDLGCSSVCGDEWLQMCLPITRREAEEIFCQ